MGWFSAVASRVSQAFVVNQLGADLDRASEALRSPDVAVRLDAVRLLALRPRGDADELLAAATRDTDASVRAAAAAACGPREWREFVPALGALLTDPDAGVRKATVFSKEASQEKIYKELWERGEKLGADAVINAKYGDSHVSALSWGKTNATGTAIKFKAAAAPAAQ